MDFSKQARDETQDRKIRELILKFLLTTPMLDNSSASRISLPPPSQQIKLFFYIEEWR